MEPVWTKLEAPLISTDTIVRPRLLGRVDEIAHRRVTQVRAPAGYGKTTLLGQWYLALKQRSETVAWLSQDSSDTEELVQLHYVAHALLTAHVLGRHDIDRVFAASNHPTTQSLITFLINALERCDSSVYLFLDDAHLMGEAASHALSQLIMYAPSTLHVVVATRATLSLNLARHRANGELVELSAEELRFTVGEIEQFMSEVAKRPLQTAELALLEKRSEGWITAIKLISLALRKDVVPGELLATISGNWRSIADFFNEEVLASQNESIRTFLLQTSILERFCPALCNAVTARDDALDVLSHIEQSELFLIPLDEERRWFRFHHLFSEFLQRRLTDEQPSLRPKLHASACTWFWKTGASVEAIEHALQGGDPERAAELLEQRCLDMTYRGLFMLALKYVAQIPEEILSRYPRVLLSQAWLFTRNLRFEDARSILKRVRLRLDQMIEASEIVPEEARKLEYILLHREMVLSAGEDNALRVEEQCKYLINEFPEEHHPYLTGTIYAELLYANREQYKLSDLDRLHATAQGILNRSEYSFGKIALQASLGPSLFFVGKTDAAIWALEEGLQEAREFGGGNLSLMALPALPLSELVYENNDLDRAERLINECLPSATAFGFVDQLMPGFITQARIRRSRGNSNGAYNSLDKGLQLAVERKLERLTMALTAERVRLLIQDGHSDKAVAEARSAGIQLNGTPPLPRGEVRSQQELAAMIWARIAQNEDRSQDALSVIKHWRVFCASRGAIRSLIRWDVMLAHFLYVNGDLRSARRALREAITHAAASRMIRSFIDEGPAIGSLLTATYDVELEVLHPSDAFASELIEAFGHPGGRQSSERSASQAPAEGLYGKLSPKEREILVLVSTGMRNGEVAQKLGMTEGSVKWYMQQVYDKVGTRRRLQAVERARQFGLIN